MKTIKHLFASGLVLLFIAEAFTIEPKVSLQLLIAALVMIFILSILFFRESIEKMKNIVTLNIRFTRGLAYCLCSLPFFYSLLNKPSNYPFLNWQIVLYFLILFLAIFNYGIKIKQIKE
ncbi:MAG TPA: hypothetical protein ENJ95_16240 [Bacteroidetes bacterium]|nr:hypothetical protein [Bacteroidota bacterium]